MSNMSYVRYENTLADLRDCEENLPLDDERNLSESENKAKERLIAMTEKALDKQVKELCVALGWERYHTYRSMHSPAGYPDLTLVRRGPRPIIDGVGQPSRLIFAELKTHLGTVSPEQQKWLDLLGATCAEVYVWRPGMLQEIADILR